MRIVIKIGTSVFSRLGQKSGDGLASLIREIVFAKKRGHEILLVSSGAIAQGMKHLRWRERPKEMKMKQAAASVGQVALMQIYQKLFAKQKITVAQVLLTREDFQSRARYLNAKNTLATLLEQGVIPIINENDTVSVEEIQFGDNDTLSALVAAKMDAQMLVLLTDVEGLRNSRTNEIVPFIPQISPEIETHASRKSKSGMGTGGMLSKIEAAKIATASGVDTFVANGFRKGTLTEILNGKSVGTKFLAWKALSAKEKWILFGAKAKGEIIVDRGAEQVLKFSGKSLLPAGILKVTGSFSKGDVAKISSESGAEFARGIVSFSSKEIEMMKGKKSAEIQKILGTTNSSFEVVHRDSLVLLS